jgi:hypothetical protein
MVLYTEILGIQTDYVRKKMVCFKRVGNYLSFFQKIGKNYNNLNLPCVYFQKILNADWEEVLHNLNSLVIEDI